MSKRGRKSKKDLSISGSTCYITDLQQDVLTYLLSFAWYHTYRLALVNKQFLSITRSKSYWRALGQHALKGFLPECVLKEVDFFYDLKPKHGPHGWLWGLVSKPDTNPDTAYARYELMPMNCVFRLKDSRKCLRITTFGGCTNNQFMFMRYKTKRYGLVEGPRNMIARIFFNFPSRRKDVITFTDYTSSDIDIVYAEYWDTEHEQLWCGMVKIDGSEWIERNGFGVWVDAEDVKF